jgi:predicted aspartyl protease
LLHASRIAGRLVYGGVLIVPVELNGTVLRFVADTGATYCSINKKLLDKIAAEPTVFTFDIAPIGTEPISTSMLRVENFVVGGTAQNNVLVAVVNFPEGFHLDGLLGMNFLGKYRITIETDTATLILRETKKKK